MLPWVSSLRNAFSCSLYCSSKISVFNLGTTVKFRKISPRAYIFQWPFLRGLFLEGLIFGGAYLRREICVYKLIWASPIVRTKFTVFALFYFVFEGNFPSTSPRGLIFGGAYTWRGLFSEFYGNCNSIIYVDVVSLKNFVVSLLLIFGYSYFLFTYLNGFVCTVMYPQ